MAARHHMGFVPGVAQLFNHPDHGWGLASAARVQIADANDRDARFHTILRGNPTRGGSRVNTPQRGQKPGAQVQLVGGSVPEFRCLHHSALRWSRLSCTMSIN